MSQSNEIIKLLKENKKKLKKFGVKRIGVFGSVVRGELKEDSDIDIVVEFERNRGDMYDFIGLIEFLEKLLNRRVDVLTKDGVENIRLDHVKQQIKEECLYV